MMTLNTYDATVATRPRRKIVVTLRISENDFYIVEGFAKAKGLSV
jgi:hypothetical protein